MSSDDAQYFFDETAVASWLQDDGMTELGDTRNQWFGGGDQDSYVDEGYYNEEGDGVPYPEVDQAGDLGGVDSAEADVVYSTWNSPVHAVAPELPFAEMHEPPEAGHLPLLDTGTRTPSASLAL